MAISNMPGKVVAAGHRVMSRDMLVALSLANLCFLRVWAKNLIYSAPDTYLMKQPPSPGCLAAICLNVVALAVLLRVACAWVRKTHGGSLPGWAYRAFLLLFLIPLNGFRGLAKSSMDEWLASMHLSKVWLFTAGIVGVLFLLYLFHAQSRRAGRVMAALVLALLPLLPGTFSWAAIQAARYDPRPFSDRPLAARLAPGPTSRPRMIWIIFDEMDQRLSFIDRPATLSLPEFDRLRAESLHAENAYPPAPDTLTSIPAMIAGETVADLLPHGPSEALLRHAQGAPPLAWSKQPNIFSAARQMGFNTAVVGWYHPYCRVLSDSLTDCWWWEFETQNSSLQARFPQMMRNQLRSTVETSLMSPFGQSLATEMRARNYGEMLERARRVAADPAIGLALFHLPATHAPYAYDRTTGTFTRSNAPFRGYLDGLALADRTLGELRRALEQAGLWDRTALLVSADHWYRSAEALGGNTDQRVPFLLKLPGQKYGLAYNNPFNTVVTHDILLAVLAGELAAPAGVPRWLKRYAPVTGYAADHARPGPSSGGGMP